MLNRLHLLLACFAVLLTSVATTQAQDTDLAPLVAAFDGKGFANTEKAIDALAATGDPRAVPVLEALTEGDLYVVKADRTVVRAERGGAGYLISDPITGEALGEVGRRAVSKVKVNNNLRRVISAALGGLTLRSSDPQVRRDAANAVFAARDVDALESIEAALAAETDTDVKQLMQEARASILLASQEDEDVKLEAIEVLHARGDQAAIAILAGLQSSESEALAQAAQNAVQAIESNLAAWNAVQNIWYGISLGSVLLLAAIGLAITFGVMGVINMAHGEMVMIGAYVTFVVQEVIRTTMPGLFDWSLAIALPLAFMSAGLVGMAIERGVIRYLYGRPLETLLATWGLSLILQQAVRTMFGPTNREVGNPSWMSGAFDVGGLTITYSRLWIVLFSIAVLLTLMLVLRRTSFGLQMRAVTQNRAMASAMGIRTNWIDALTFGLGSGIAGIAGVALSQIDNVSPNLGQTYIIDSFMVVVFGGVGNLWGTLVGAMTLGVANKFLEPYAGAVLAKILVLVVIILFIQKRPRGLFALKGRAVEA